MGWSVSSPGGGGGAGGVGGGATSRHDGAHLAKGFFDPLELKRRFLQAVNIARPRHTRFAGDRARELRHDLTVSEARLWGGIKKKATGARFRRQVPIGRWIVDFASLEPRIVIEVDDPSHLWRDERDRTRHLEDRGFTILRFDNAEVAAHIDEVLGTIERVVAELRDGGLRDPGSYA